VYWRRRALVLAAVLVVLFLVAQACMASASPDGVAGPPTAPPSSPGSLPPAAPSSTPSGAPAGDGQSATGSPGPAGGQAVDPPDEDACTDQEIRVTAEAERTDLPSGTPVGFTIRVRNASGRTCSRDVGADLQELYLVRGTGTVKVWSSDDCGAAQGNDVIEFPPDHEQSYSVTWNGRSSDECAGQPEAPSGTAPDPGAYQLFGRLGTAYSEPVPITLT
jgi:hypothetical protein